MFEIIDTNTQFSLDKFGAPALRVALYALHKNNLYTEEIAVQLETLYLRLGEDVASVINILDESNILDQYTLDEIMFQNACFFKVIIFLYEDGFLNRNMIFSLGYQSENIISAIMALKIAGNFDVANLNVLIMNSVMIENTILLSKAGVLNQNNFNAANQQSDDNKILSILLKFGILNQNNLNVINTSEPDFFVTIQMLGDVEILNQERFDILQSRYKELIGSMLFLEQSGILNINNFSSLTSWNSIITPALSLLFNEKILNELNFNLIISRCHDMERATDTLNKKYILKNLALSIQLNYLLMSFQRLVDDRNNTNLYWLINVFRKSHRIANMEFSIANSYEYIKDLTHAYIALNLEHSDPISVVENANLCLFKYDRKFSKCEICTVCDHDDLITLDCGHDYHKECYNNGLESYVNQERLDKVGVCLKDNCSHKLNPVQLASIVKGPETLMAIQRLLIRSVDGVMFCPSCPYGLTKEDKFLRFSSKCNSCNKEQCFACGRKPHVNISCSQMNLDIELLREIVANRESDQFGKCPHCKITLGKHGGCDAMRCGRDTDRNRISSHKGKGCGMQFNWNNRITIEAWLKIYDDSSLQADQNVKEVAVRNVI